MKVYVDELPERCSECDWFTPNHCSKNGRNFCLLARMPFYNTEEERKITRGQHKDTLSDFDCPLQSLSDYTKQVRKEVVQEIREHIPICSGMPMVIMLDDTHSLNNILDQIQGETK